MNGSEENPNRRQDIQSSLNSIVESSDKWLERIRRREMHVRLASSFLTASLVFVVIGSAILGFFLSQGGALHTFFDHQNIIFQMSFTGASAIAGIISGITTYFLLKRKHDVRLKDLSSLVTEMKQKVREHQKDKEDGGEGIANDALSLAEKIMTLLPELVRKRNLDSILFGAVAFIVANVVIQDLAGAIVIGILVWLYIRHRTKKTYEQELSKFEEQKRVFDQRKKDFINTL